MNEPDDTTGNRIGLFFVGLSIAAICGLITWLLFALATMKMDSALRGWAYLSEVWECLLTAEWLFVVISGLSFMGTLLGLLMIAMSFGLGSSKPTAIPAAGPP